MPLPDLLTTPSPDEGHEAIRLAVLEALLELRGGPGKAAIRDAIQTLRADVAALTARVDALTLATPTAPEDPLAN